jgi:lipid-A-disaccharide synthase
MAAAGVTLLYPLTRLAVMWFGRVASHLITFIRLAARAKRYFRTHRPHAVVLVDFPGFHWHIAKRAKAAGIPVYYFVPPQLWAWAGWRVTKVKRNFEAVLTALAFEEEWYRSRGVRTHCVGHPYFDELARQRLDPHFLAEQRAKPGPVVALLPGSRNQEVSLNFPTMLAAAKVIRSRCPAARFLVAAFNDDQAAVCRNLAFMEGVPADVHVGRTPELIELATCCVAVSGSVGLELLNKAKPTVVVYRVSRLMHRVALRLKTCPYISLVNLLAGEELYPECASASDESAAVARHVTAWLTDNALLEALVTKLRKLKAQVAVPGACDRAADFLLAEISGTPKSTRRVAA